MKDNLALELRDSAKSQLLEIRTIESGVEYLNKMKAIEVWAKAEKKDAELQNIIAEQKLRTQRVLGSLIKQGQDSGELKTQADNQYACTDGKQALSDIGLSRKQSSTFQQIASIPDDTFEEFIAEKKQAVNNAVAELTTTGAVRLARSLKDKDESAEEFIVMDQELRIEKEIKSVAHNINMTYTKEQRKKIVSLIKI